MLLWLFFCNFAKAAKYTCGKEKDESIFKLLNRIDKAIGEHGFSAKRMSKPDIKRMLALYFGTSITGDEIPDVEGENYFDEEEFDEE